jgi:hypothetical protein
VVPSLLPAQMLLLLLLVMHWRHQQLHQLLL